MAAMVPAEAAAVTATTVTAAAAVTAMHKSVLRVPVSLCSVTSMAHDLGTIACLLLVGGCAITCC
jgi:hypothetical protein